MPEFWRVVRAEVGHEPLAKRSIEELGIEAYLPLYVLRKRCGRRSELIRTALLPGYLFARFDEDHARWPDIYRCRGVAGGKRAILCDAQLHPKVVSDAEIEIVRVEAAKYEGVVCEIVPFSAMQAVKIIEGAFAGRAGKIAWADDTPYVGVECEIFGRTTPVTVLRDHVAPAA